MARFSQIGGHPAVDLLNTVDWRLDPRRRSDRLSSMADVLSWCRESSLLSDTEAGRLEKESQRARRTAAVEFGRILGLRDSVYACLIDGEREPSDVIASAYREAIDQARLTSPSSGAVWAWVDQQLGLHTPRHRLGMSAVELLTDPRAAQVRQCQDKSCGWAFLDLSPRGNRRWCVSTECGNRNRVRSHYQRRSIGTSAQAGT